MKTYELVEIGKAKQKVSSDRGFALLNGLTVQNISDWKAGRANPSAANFLKLCIAAGLDIQEALIHAEQLENNKKLRQAGFADVALLTGVAGLGILSLAVVTGMVSIPATSGLAPLAWEVLYIMRNITACYAKLVAWIKTTLLLLTLRVTGT